jgi:SAM-dependent methyltransferase/methyltransferase-like protein
MQVADPPATPYDEVLYPSGLFPQTHPDRLATAAYLRGMSPAPIDHCRVLELGCGSANNLVSMAFQLPGSEFVGIDLGRVPIASGEALVAELKMQNVTLRAIDICDLNPDEVGAFDFIIAHGVYSWVPDRVRERILEISRKILNPQGIAYISYNAYPGCHFRDLVRYMMRFHTQKFEGVNEKATQARALVKFVAESRIKPDYYTEAFRTQLGRLEKYQAESLYHDDLNPSAQPFYFHEFIEAAERHDLKYVGEAVQDASDRALFTDETLRRMTELEGANEIIREQYKDFLCGTGFRQTLLCKKETQLAAVFLEERIPELFAECDFVAMNDQEQAGDASIEFKSPRGGRIEITDPVWRAGLSFICSQWPRSVSFEQILNHLKQTEPGKSADGGSGGIAARIASGLKQSYLTGIVSLRVRPPDVANRVCERPAISLLAQAQLRLGISLSSQLHRSIKPPDVASKHFMSLLDGTRDIDALAAEMIAFTTLPRAQTEGERPAEDPTLEAGVKERVKNNLTYLMRGGMLVG